MLYEITYEKLEQFLNDSATRIIDSRILELSEDFTYTFQVLDTDRNIWSCNADVGDHTSKIRPLDLFKLQYRNNPRNNPGLYGLLDEADTDG
jgi:hypothetical protein